MINNPLIGCNMRETRRKSIIKTITWRITATVITVIVIFVFSGDLVFSSELGLLINGIKAGAYYLHERIYAGMM